MPLSQARFRGLLFGKVFIKNSVVLELRVIYNIGVVGCLLEDDYIHRYDYQIQKEEDL